MSRQTNVPGTRVNLKGPLHVKWIYYIINHILSYCLVICLNSQ